MANVREFSHPHYSIIRLSTVVPETFGENEAKNVEQINHQVLTSAHPPKYLEGHPS